MGYGIVNAGDALQGDSHALDLSGECDRCFEDGGGDCVAVNHPVSCLSIGEKS